MSRRIDDLDYEVGTDPVRVLHVDDDREFAELAADCLEDELEHLQVETAGSAREALAHLGDHAVDCVVSDYDMPDLNGIELLREVRETWPDLPFVLFTGKGSEEVAAEAVSAGATDYLQKDTGTDQYTLLANRITNAVGQHRAEREAARSRDRLRTVLDHAPWPMFVLDEDVVYRLSNEAHAAVHGRSVEDIEGRPAEEVLPEPAYESLREDLRDVIASGTPATFEEITIRDAEGTERIFESRLVPFEGTDDRTALGVAVDVTERTRRERRLRRYERIIENLPVAVFRSTPDGTFREANPAFASLLGVDSTEEVIGANAADFSVEEFDADELVERLEEGPITDEVRIRTADGDEVWVETTLSLVEYDGERYVEGISRDVTDRREHERRLRRSQRRFEAVFDSPHSFIGILDPDGRLRKANRAALEFVGTDPSDVEGRPFPETPWWSHSADLQADLREWIDRAAGGEYVQFEATHYGTDGEEVVADGVIRPVRDEDGEIASLIAEARDVSERKERERELQRQNEWLEEFAGIVSHDLRNPLRAAAGHLELAREERDSERLAAVAEAHERMDALIEDLLALGRDGLAAIDPGTADLAAVAERSWRTVENGEASLRVETDATVRADADRLQQLVENLFGNAIEHGGENVSEVALGDTDGGFYVEDDGRGVPAEDREAIFHSGYSTGEGGTGLGLTIVEGIAAAHGWDVSVADGSLGGARVEITGVERVG